MQTLNHNSDQTPLGLILVPGPQAEKFLQGQVTCDVREVTEQQSRCGAHCDPKGRVQFTFRLLKREGNYYLQLPQVMIAHALNCLQKYAALFRIKLEEVPSNETETKLAAIAAGIATIYPETIGLFTPHQLNSQLINAISFNKGCYTGQEIIARMHYLGKLKQQMYRVRFAGTMPPLPGTKLYNNEGQAVGELVAAALETENTLQALAVLQTNAITSPIHLENSSGTILTLLDLPYTVPISS